MVTVGGGQGRGYRRERNAGVVTAGFGTRAWLPQGLGRGRVFRRERNAGVVTAGVGTRAWLP